VGYKKRGEVAEGLFKEGRGCRRVKLGGEWVIQKGEILLKVIRREGCRRVKLGGEVGYTKRGEIAEGLFEEGRGCRRVILRGEMGYTKRGEVSDGLHKEGGERLPKGYTSRRGGLYKMRRVC
jgi:hypothetical protein